MAKPGGHFLSGGAGIGAGVHPPTCQSSSHSWLLDSGHGQYLLEEIKPNETKWTVEPICNQFVAA